MRIKINFTNNTQPVPNNLKHVNSWFHKCMGNNNDLHDRPSDYTLSGMCGGSITDGGKTKNFPNGGYILFTTENNEIIEKLIMGSMSNSNFGFGMSLADVDFIDETMYSGFNHFKTTEYGFIIKEKDENGKVKFITLEDDMFIDKVKKHIIAKFSKINPKLRFDDLDIEMNDHKGNKVRNVMVKDIVNKSNVCQLTIKCNSALAKAIYHYGIGQSTGSGFGTVYNTKNLSKYGVGKGF